MKKCNRCNNEFEVSMFPKRRGKLLGVCSRCYQQHYGDPATVDQTYRDKIRQANARRKERCRSYMATILTQASCMDCGISDPIVLEFDHREPDAKYRDISEIILDGSIEVLKNELGKCDIVCANCHRRRTTAMQNHWRQRLLLCAE